MLFSKDSKNIYDITAVSRSDYLDPTDPGGRLGAYNGLLPDTRNLAAFWIPVQKGDIIASMSDGVHDNLDPQLQGLSPSDFDAPYDSWENAPDEWVVAVKQSYLRHFTRWLIRDIPFTPNHIKDTLINHCIKNTTKSREYLSTNPSMRTPGGYKEYPGKLDHCTIACIKVDHVDPKNDEIPSTCDTPHIVFSCFKESSKNQNASNQNLSHVIDLVKTDMKLYGCESATNRTLENVARTTPVFSVTSEDIPSHPGRIRKKMRSVRHSEMLSPLHGAATQLFKKGGGKFTKPPP